MLPSWLKAILAELDNDKLCDCEPIESKLVRYMIEDRLGNAILHSKLEQRGIINSNYWSDYDYWEEAERTIPFYSDGE